MEDSIGQAQKALRRGGSAEALVYLWNAVEPARLAGDRSQLAKIRGLAQAVARQGDEAERREAQRLVSLIETAAVDEAAVPATERLDATVQTPGGEITAADFEFDAGTERGAPERGGAPEREAEAEEGEQQRGRPGFLTLVWLLVVIAIVVMNVLRDGPGE